jgi:hypothetical protein
MTPFGELPFGGRAAAIYSLNTEPATYGTLVDIPRFQGLEMAEEEDSTEMNAGDVRVALHTSATRLTGSLTYGGLNQDSLAMLNGGTAGAVTGTLPARLQTFTRRSTNQKKYFKVAAQIYGDDAGDDHFIAYKVKCSGGPTFSFTQGEFMATAADLEGVFTAESPGKLYDIIAHETALALV